MSQANKINYTAIASAGVPVSASVVVNGNAAEQKTETSEMVGITVHDSEADHLHETVDHHEHEHEHEHDDHQHHDMLHTTILKPPSSSSSAAAPVQPVIAAAKPLTAPMGVGVGALSMDGNEPIPVPHGFFHFPSTDKEWEQNFRHPSTNKYLGVSLYKTPKHTLIQLIRAGMAKAALPWWHIVILGFMAGCYIGIGGTVALTIGAGFNNIDAAYKSIVQKIAGSVSFPIALMMIVVAGGELFTGNVMYLLAAFLTKKITGLQLLRSWFFSYTANFIGCVVFAFIFISSTTTSLQSSDAQTAYLYKMLDSKTHDGWGAIFLKGIACNWLVCFSLWWAACSEDMSGKIVAIWWPIMAFVFVGFEHSIANMFYLTLGLMNGGPSNFGLVLAWNLIPVTLGNILGGAFFIFMQVIIFGPYFHHQHIGIQSGQKKTPLTAAAFKAAFKPTFGEGKHSSTVD